MDVSRHGVRSILGAGIGRRGIGAMTVQFFTTTGNLLQITATFTPTTGSAAPNAANMQFEYFDVRGRQRFVNIPLVLQSDGTWQQEWSLAVVEPGSWVEWICSCSGPLVAATNGIFQVSGIAGPGCDCSQGWLV